MLPSSPPRKYQLVTAVISSKHNILCFTASVQNDAQLVDIILIWKNFSRQ